jgi:hypothetical protein
MIEEVFVVLTLIFSTAFTAFLWNDALLLTFSLLILAIFVLRHFHTKNDIITFIVVGIGGSFVESICIYFGAWYYAKPLYLIPLWLPFLWGLAGLIIRRFTLEIENNKKS